MKRYILLLIFFTYHLNIFSRTLDIVTLEYPPYIYQDNNSVDGLSVEIIKEVFHRLDIPITITIVPWVRALNQIKTGESDAIFTIYKTKERLDYIDFSKEVIIYQIVSLFTNYDSNIEYNGILEDIKNLNIGIVRGVSYGNIFDEAVKSNKLKNLYVANNGSRNFEMLLNNRVDIVVSNKYGAYHIIGEKKLEVKELFPEIERIPSYIGFSKVRGLLHVRDDFDKVLIEVKQDGTYNSIIKKYLD